MPSHNRYGPLGTPTNKDRVLIMTVDEYESIRLIDLEGFTQEECANQINVARSTVQNIYASARKKIAESLVDGKSLLIEGGEYKLCDGKGNGCGLGCRKKRGFNKCNKFKEHRTDSDLNE